MSKITYRIFNSTDILPYEDWVGLQPKAIEDINFFKALDKSNFEQFKFFYILIYKDDKPIASATSFLMDFPLDISVDGFSKKITNFIKKFLPWLINPRVIVCGMPMGEGRIGALNLSTDILEAIDLALHELATKNKAPLIFYKDMNASISESLQPLLQKGYSRIESYPNTILNINFLTFEEYLKTLSSSSREGIKRNFKRIDSRVKFDLKETSSLNAIELDEVYDLYLQTYNSHELGFEKLPKDFFINIALFMPNEVKFFLWRVDNKLVTFALCLKKGDYFIDYYLGFDYKVSIEYYLYFVRFRDLLKWSLSNGVKKYEMGQTSYEAKRRLGFEFVKYYLYIKHTKSLWNFVLKPVINILKPSNFDPIFKLIK